MTVEPTKPQDWLRVAIRSVALLAVLVAGCTLSLVLSDTAQNKAHTVQAVRAAIDHGALGVAGFERYGAKHSNFSECIGLSISIRQEPATVWSSLQSNAILWQPPRDICESLAAYLEGEEVKWFPYSRYWHGYRLYQQVVLSVASYRALQWSCLVLVVLALIYWTAMQARLLGYTIAASSSALVLLTTDIANVYLTPTHAISIAVLFLAAGEVTRRAVTGRYIDLIPWCFAAGALYNFFDFLYNPDALVLAVGFSLAVAAVRHGDAIHRLICQLVLGQVAVAAGYVAMWICKWLLVYGARVIFEPIPWLPRADIARWIAGGEKAYVPFESLSTLANVSWQIGFNGFVLPGLLSVAFVLTLLLVMRGQWKVVATLAACLILPAVMLEAKSAHTIAHATFTFRMLPVAVSLLALTLLWACFYLRRMRRPAVQGTS